jgi:putative ABC transport system permease protein
MQMVMSTRLDAAVVAKGVRKAISGLDPALPIAKVSTIEDLVSASIAQPRFNMMLLASLAVSAALLAAVGVYGVVSYSVARRTVEIGVRMALGSDAGRTFRLVVLGAARVVLVGVVIGLGGAVAAGRSLQHILFGVPPLDVVTFAASGVAIIVVGIVAAGVPALRAGQIDPVSALRQE